MKTKLYLTSSLLSRAGEMLLSDDVCCCYRHFPGYDTEYVTDTYTDTTLVTQRIDHKKMRTMNRHMGSTAKTELVCPVGV